MKKTLNKNLKSSIVFIASMLVLWLIWVIAVKIVKNEYLIPSFSLTVKEFFALMKERFFYLSYLMTVYRALLTVAVSLILGVIFAVLSLVFKPVRSIIKVLVSIVRTLPTMAIILLILFWASPTYAPVFVGVLVVFPMAYSQILTALLDEADEMRKVIKVFNLSTKKAVSKIYLPKALPVVLEKTGENLSFAIKLIVSSEVMANTFRGVGGMIQTASVYMEPSRLMALTLFAVITGVLIELIFSATLKPFFKWNREG